MSSSRRGLYYFLVYLIFYTTFVLISAYQPALLEHEIGGVTLALHGGIFLIVCAIGMAMLYCWACREKNT